MAAKNRTVDMRGLTLQVAALEIIPTSNSNNNVAAGSTKSLTAAEAGKVINLDTLTGSTVTLPASTGLGAVYTFVVTVLATSNSHVIKVANASDIMVGAIATVDTDTSDAYAAFATASTSDTITLNRSTTGSVRTGERIVVRDVALNRWQVEGLVFVTGTPATPFSATV